MKIYTFPLPTSSLSSSQVPYHSTRHFTAGRLNVNIQHAQAHLPHPTNNLPPGLKESSRQILLLLFRVTPPSKPAQVESLHQFSSCMQRESCAVVRQVVSAPPRDPIGPSPRCMRTASPTNHTWVACCNIHVR